MTKKSHIIIMIVLLPCFSLAGCGGDGAGPAGTTGNIADNQNPPAAILIKGVFIDSPVNGLEYQGNPSGRSGITGESGVNGEFTVAATDSVTFRLGNLFIGTTNPLFIDRIITPTSLTGISTLPPSAHSIRIAQLLQSLDSDRIPANGISIAPEVRDRFRNGSINTAALQSALQDGQNFDSVLGSMIQPLTSGNANRAPNQIVSFINARLELQTGERMAAYLNFAWPTTGAPIAFINSLPAGLNVIALNGARSFDPDNQPITYLWSIITHPLGANPTLSSPAFLNTNFSFSSIGDYSVELKVTDSSGLSSTDIVYISYDGTVTIITYRNFGGPNLLPIP